MWARDFVYPLYELTQDGRVRDIGATLIVADCPPPDPEPRPFLFADRDEEFSGCPPSPRR